MDSPIIGAASGGVFATRVVGENTRCLRYDGESLRLGDL